MDSQNNIFSPELNFIKNDSSLFIDNFTTLLQDLNIILSNIEIIINEIDELSEFMK